jgi:uncharacterized membrane protein
MLYFVFVSIKNFEIQELGLNEFKKAFSMIYYVNLTIIFIIVLGCLLIIVAIILSLKYKVNTSSNNILT